MSLSRSSTLAPAAVLLALTVGTVTGCTSGGGGSDTSGRQSHAAVTAEPASSAQAEQAVDSLLATGLKLVGDRQYDAAVATFHQVLDLSPHDSYALYDLGYVAQLRGDDATAITSYTDALSHDRDFVPALYNLAILTEGTDLPAAVALYRREVTVMPDDAAAYMRLGFALRHLGRSTEATAMLDKGIALDPSLSSATSPTYR